jgi:hypothetical protein
MGNKVNFLAEVDARLRAAQLTTLSDIKRIRWGSEEESRGQKDFPVLTLAWESGNEEPDYPNKQNRDDIRVKIILHHKKLASQTNDLFDTSTSKGVVYLFEKVLDVLDKKTDGVVDNTFNATADFLRVISYDVNQYNELYEIVAVMTAKTKSFAAGGRSS